MHSNTNRYAWKFTPSWNLANLGTALLLTMFFLILLLLWMTFTAPPAYGQQSVPPTARQAATMPQFAAKLGRRAQPASPIASRGPRPDEPRASYKNPIGSRADNSLGGQLNISPFYENGPINGTTDAWTLNFGFVVADTFTVSASAANVQGFNFGAWLSPGDVLQTVEVSITSQPFGGTTYFDSVVSFTQSACSGNQYGFNVCTETSANFTGPNLTSGTYWLNLSNAVVNTDDPVYWDENAGAGCQSQGCPSQADENTVGTIPSEAFTLLADTNCFPNCPPECVHDGELNGATFELIHNFTATEQSPAPGLAMDPAGNLYGASAGGTNSLGLAYKLAAGANWALTSLYSFVGGATGQNPLAETLASDRTLYGAASGGLQTCGNSGNQFCGLIYRLRPSAFVCRTALCSWNEEVVYQFTGDPDGWQPTGRPVFDEAGNLYGITTKGGLFGQGTVYEVMPAAGGWTEKVLFSFPGGSGGAFPNSLLLGQDGNLYGTTDNNGVGVIFQLVTSGNNWIENVLATFTCAKGDGCFPLLVQEYAGSFYGVYSYRDEDYCDPDGCFPATFGRIFTLSSNGKDDYSLYTNSDSA